MREKKQRGIKNYSRCGQTGSMINHGAYRDKMKWVSLQSIRVNVVLVSLRETCHLHMHFRFFEANELDTINGV